MTDNRGKMPPDGYSIRTKWIGPLEGTEYTVHVIGNKEVLAFRKSWKAACRAAWNHKEGKLKE